MPRKGARVSPESAANTRRAIARYHAEHYEILSIHLHKGKRAGYKRLADARGTRVATMIQAYMDAEYRKEFGTEIL